MRELNVNELTGGSKLMNILRKSLPEAKDSFFYKMLRKKNITLNNKRPPVLKLFQQEMLSNFS